MSGDCTCDTDPVVIVEKGAVLDPRFRDQLAGAATAVGDMAEDWWCPKREGVRRTECRYCIAEFAIDAVLPLVEARVQAATNQRSAEELRAAAVVYDGDDFREFGMWLRDRAAALVSPAPAPHAEEGQ